MIKGVMKMGLTLMVVGALAAAGLGLTYSVTRDRIAEQERLREAEACVSSLPGVESAEELEEQEEMERRASERYPAVQKIFTCRGTGAVVLAKAKGYGGPIIMAVGIDRSGEVVGVTVISNNETPGLGGNVVKEDFLGQFKGKTAEDSFTVGEDIQAITGATITSKAATSEVKAAVEAYHEYVEGSI